jgi:hypothetical protein
MATDWKQISIETPPQNDFILEFAIKGKKTQILIWILPGETLVLPTPWVSQYLH